MLGEAEILVYPFFIFLGVLSALLLIRMRGYRQYLRKVETPVIRSSDIYWVVAVTFIGTAAGARIGYVAFHWHQFADNPASLLFIWRGGLIFHGGLIGGLIASFLYCIFRKISWLHLLDFSVAPISAGYAVGRIGCFFHGCCAGIPTDLPIGVVFPIFGEAARHPTQLYAVIAGIIMFLVLDSVYRKARIPAVPAAWFFLLHGTYRFLIELIRIEPDVLLGLTHGQVFGILMILCGAVLLYIRKRAFSRGKLKEEYLL